MLGRRGCCWDGAAIVMPRVNRRGAAGCRAGRARPGGDPVGCGRRASLWLVTGSPAITDLHAKDQCVLDETRPGTCAWTLMRRARQALSAPAVLHAWNPVALRIPSGRAPRIVGLGIGRAAPDLGWVLRGDGAGLGPWEPGLLNLSLDVLWDLECVQNENTDSGRARSVVRAGRWSRCGLGGVAPPATQRPMAGAGRIASAFSWSVRGVRHDAKKHPARPVMVGTG